MKTAEKQTGKLKPNLSEPSAGRWIVAQEGSRQTYAVPVSFHRLGLLRLFYVDTWCRYGRDLLRRGTKGLRALATHWNQELPSEKVISFNFSLMRSRTAFHFRKHRLSPAQLSDEYCRFGSQFACLVREHLRRQALDPEQDIFFGFNTNCLESIEYLRRQGIFTVVDQVDPARVEEDLCIEEAERWPGWAKMPGSMPQAYWDRLKAEWDTADLVLVNSDWSAQALIKQGVPADKLIVVPLAIDLPHEHLEWKKSSGPLKVLWLGSLILRKGIQYLIEAARLLQHEKIEFWLAGPVGVSETAVRSFPDNVRILGRITRDRLSDLYRQAHVFVLPTISDGFAITQLEAMAHGLPAVVTPNCGRVVTDQLDGFIVPARNGPALAEALALLNKDRARLQEMSKEALRTVCKFDLPSNARMIHELAIRHRTAKRCQGSCLLHRNGHQRAGRLSVGSIL